LQVNYGYPALQRLLKMRFIVFKDGISEDNRIARPYRWTAKRRRQFFAEDSTWQSVSDAIALILASVVSES
jgi:hypothetical protein